MRQPTKRIRLTITNTQGGFVEHDFISVFHALLYLQDLYISHPVFNALDLHIYSHNPHV